MRDQHAVERVAVGPAKRTRSNRVREGDCQTAKMGVAGKVRSPALGNGMRRASGLPVLAITIFSPAAARSTRRESGVFAS